MKKLVLVIFLVIFGVFFFLLYNLSAPKKEEKYLTNMSELYQFFTPYMESFVGSKLETIDCKPRSYYYNNSALCFVCKDMDACFGYGWVSRGEEKMNPKGKPYLVNYKKFDLIVADFYTEGLASLFNCIEKDEKSLECDNGVVFVSENMDVAMMLMNSSEFENVSRRICEYYGLAPLECLNFSCKCKNKIVGLMDGRIVTYDVIV